MTKIAILGGTGYTALELIKILLRHKEVEIASITSRREDAPDITAIHPSLTGRIKLPCEPFHVDRLVARGVECAFGCLPHGASMSALPVAFGTRHARHRPQRGLPSSRSQRLRSMVRRIAMTIWLTWRRRSTVCPKFTARRSPRRNWWPIPDAIRRGRSWALAPLVAGKHIELSKIIVDSKSGVSGAGRVPSLRTHFPECNESVSAYNVGSHRHTPEIEQTLGDDRR